MRSGNDRQRGLYHKFRVERSDGSSGPGQKHEKCRYFVLDLDHDEFALAAIEAYENACCAEFPQLAEGLLKLRQDILDRRKDGRV